MIERTSIFLQIIYIINNLKHYHYILLNISIQLVHIYNVSYSLRARVSVYIYVHTCTCLITTYYVPATIIFTIPESLDKQIYSYTEEGNRRALVEAVK